MPNSKKTSPPSQPMKVPKYGVTVRMYNAGFGDCFLLTFPDSRKKPRYMLIDCGVHNQYPDGEAKMQMIAKDIAEITHNHLDIVAISHEHEDHLLGFRYAKDIFDKIKIDDLWLAWTEDPTDTATKKLKADIKQGVAELTAAMEKLKGIDAPLASTIEGLLGFELSYGAAGETITELDYLRSKRAETNKKPLVYRHPGEEPLTIPDVSGVKVYILGPPEKYTDIKITDSAKEMYPKLAAISDFQPFVTALKSRLGNIAGEDKSNIRQNCPFDKCYDVFPEDEKCRSFFQEFYGFSKDEGQGKEWRRIDSDWLATAGELALKIGDMTNNTSLVLAFELTEAQPRKVLLFPGDAQVGNWLSWHRPKEVKIDAEDLLNRTVFYKVGHHGSRNATLRQKGLEMMKDPGLVAMIPVDEKWAKDRKKPWEHPAEKLLNSLEEKARGRVLRADRISQMPGVLVKRDTIEKGDWQTFLKHIDWDRSPNSLWIQYTIEG